VSVTNYPRQSFYAMSRKQAITTCLALEDMRDRAAAEVERLQNHRDALLHLIVQADSICSLILHRESQGLSIQSVSDLKRVVDDLRAATS